MVPMNMPYAYMNAWGGYPQSPWVQPASPYGAQFAPQWPGGAYADPGRFAGPSKDPALMAAWGGNPGAFINNPTKDPRLMNAYMPPGMTAVPEVSPQVEPEWGYGPFQDARLGAWLLLPHLIDEGDRRELSRKDTHILTNKIHDVLMDDHKDHLKGFLAKKVKQIMKARDK